MSIVSMGTAVFLLMQHDPSLEGLAIGMITTVMGYWYISSSVNHFKQQSAAPAAPPAAAPGGQTNVTQP